MSKVLKAASVRIDENNRVSIEVLDSAALTEMQESQRLDVEAGEPLDIEADEPEIIKTPEETAQGIIEAAEAEADRILNNARAEAEELIEARRAEFEEELQSLKEESLKEAFDQGYDRGYTESNGIRAEAEQILRDAYEERDETFKNIEPEMVALISDIAGKLTSDAAEINPGVISCLIRQGLDAANAPGDVTVHVSSDDYDDAVKNKNEFLSHVDTGARVDIIKDPSLKKSDCVIETPYGNIDCSLGQQFASLRESIYYILNNR